MAASPLALENLAAAETELSTLKILRRLLVYGFSRIDLSQDASTFLQHGLVCLQVRFVIRNRINERDAYLKGSSHLSCSKLSRVHLRDGGLELNVSGTVSDRGVYFLQNRAHLPAPPQDPSSSSQLCGRALTAMEPPQWYQVTVQHEGTYKKILLYPV